MCLCFHISTFYSLYFCYFQELTSLSLMGAFNFHHLQPVLSHLPNVRKLELEYSNCDDDTIKIVANNCPLLTELNVYASRVTDEGMKHLCFPEGHKLRLEILTVSRTNVREKGVLMILKNIPTMQVITHENLSRIISKAAADKEFPENTVLNLTLIEIHNAKSELQAIADLCPNIKHLFVKSIDNREQILNCCAFKKLEEVCLSFESGKRSNLCIDHLLKTCGFCISNLSLENFVLSVDVLVQSCPNLQLLELCDPVFEEPSNRQMSKLQFEKLTHFKIYGSSLLSTEDIKSPAFIIRSSPNLESMALQCCFIGPQMEDVILNCPAKLMQLDFTESLVSINFLQEILLKHRMLQCLIIENSGLHSNEFRNLFRLIDHLNHPVNILWC